MRLGILTLIAAVAAVVAAPSAKAERTNTAWIGDAISASQPARIQRSGRTQRAERRQRVRVASLAPISNVSSDAAPAPRRAARAERRQRVRVASLSPSAPVSTSTASFTGSYSAGPRPRKWCGWWMRTRRGGGPEFNLAWNWRNYGSPISGPQVGAVVIWRHHVGEIVGQAADGRWIVRSGNDGGRVRERARSVAGAIFRI